MSQQQFSFPVLDEHELLVCLGEMEIVMDASHLTKPSHASTLKVFEHIVILLTGITREELTQPVFTLMDVFEYPELHDDSIYTNNFFRQLCKLMNASGVKDFGWKDVFKPEPLRLKRHLSAVVNFAKFREDKALQLQDLQNNIDDQIARLSTLETKHAEDERELKRLQVARAEQLVEVAEVEAQEAGVTAHNTTLNREANQLQMEVRQLKAQLNQLSDQASQVKLDLASAKQETDILQDQIVQSPDKHRQAIAELAAAAEAKRTLCAQLSSHAIDKDRQLEVVAKFEKDLQRCSKLMEELDNVIAKKKDASQQVKDMKESIGTQERALSELTNTCTAFKRHHVTVQEKFVRLNNQAQLKLDAAASRIEEAASGKQAAEAEQAAAAARSAEDEALIRSVMERIQETSAAHKMVVDDVLGKFALLQDTVLSYNRRLEDAMNTSC